MSWCCIIFFCQLINIMVIVLLKAIAEAMSDNKELSRYFIILLHQISRSLHQPFCIASDLLDISNPHYADICYQIKKLVTKYSILPLPVQAV